MMREGSLNWAKLAVGQPFNPFGLFVGAFIPNAILKAECIGPAAKLCYGRLLQYAGQDGLCYPSRETLATELSMSTSTVARALKSLEEQGFIVRVRPKGRDRLAHKTTRYQVAAGH